MVEGFAFAFVFVFMFLVFYKSTFICFSLVYIWEGCSLTQILCPVAFVGIDTNSTTVAMGPSSPDHLSPDHSGFVWFASKSHCVVFGFV